jgi:hypothetical protein
VLGRVKKNHPPPEPFGEGSANYPLRAIWMPTNSLHSSHSVWVKENWQRSAHFVSRGFGIRMRLSNMTRVNGDFGRINASQGAGFLGLAAFDRKRSGTRKN